MMCARRERARNSQRLGGYRFVPILSISGLVILAGLVIGLHIMTEKLNAGGGGLRAYHDKLTPQVAIYRSDGTRVAGGVMPFG